jgi:hypothetical protein
MNGNAPYDSYGGQGIYETRYSRMLKITLRDEDEAKYNPLYFQ